MKHFKFILGIIILFSSCNDDEKLLRDQVANSPSLVKFDQDLKQISTLINVDSFYEEIPITVVAPNELDYGSIEFIPIIEETSTAIEGYHYRYEPEAFVLSSTDKFVSPYIEILTNVTAQDVFIEFSIELISQNGEIIDCGKSLRLELEYRSNLNGTYLVSNDFCDTRGRKVQITQAENGISWFLTEADGGWLDGCTASLNLLNWGQIYERQGIIASSQNLRYGVLNIGVVLGGTWDQEAGILRMKHRDDFFNKGPYQWNSTYVRIDD